MSQTSQASSTSPARSRYVRYRRPLCDCGVAPVLLLSGTDDNPDRFFWKCRNYDKPCKYWAWADEVFDPCCGEVKQRMTDLIMKLRAERSDKSATIRKLEEELAEERTRARQQMSDLVMKIHADKIEELKVATRPRKWAYLITGALCAFIVVLLFQLSIGTPTGPKQCQAPGRFTWKALP